MRTNQYNTFYIVRYAHSGLNPKPPQSVWAEAHTQKPVMATEGCLIRYWWHESQEIILKYIEQIKHPDSFNFLDGVHYGRQHVKTLLSQVLSEARQNVIPSGTIQLEYLKSLSILLIYNFKNVRVNIMEQKLPD
jgi:hypothetical protein